MASSTPQSTFISKRYFQTPYCLTGFHVRVHPCCSVASINEWNRCLVGSSMIYLSTHRVVLLYTAFELATCVLAKAKGLHPGITYISTGAQAYIMYAEEAQKGSFAAGGAGWCEHMQGLLYKHVAQERDSYKQHIQATNPHKRIKIVAGQVQLWRPT